MARPDVSKSTKTVRTCAVVFPNGSRTASVNPDGSRVRVDPQTSAVLDLATCKAWGAYYTAAAEILEEA